MLEFLCGILVMSVLATIGFLIYDDGNKDSGLILLGPAMWVFSLGFFLLYAIVKLVKGRKYTLYTLEEIKKLNSYYKHLGGDYHMIRYYGNKNKHPILYHLIIIEKIKIIDN